MGPQVCPQPPACVHACQCTSAGATARGLPLPFLLGRPTGCRAATGCMCLAGGGHGENPQRGASRNTHQTNVQPSCLAGHSGSQCLSCPQAWGAQLVGCPGKRLTRLLGTHQLGPWCGAWLVVTNKSESASLWPPTHPPTHNASGNGRHPLAAAPAQQHRGGVGACGYLARHYCH